MNQAPVMLNGELTISQVAELKPVLQATLQEPNTSGIITLDLGGVSECDGAGMQLLLVYVHAAAAAGRAVALCHMPVALSELLAEYGIAARFLDGMQEGNS